MDDSGRTGDKRRFRRRELLCRVELLPAGQAPGMAIARDLSGGGILLGTSTAVLPDTPIKVSIPLQGGRSAVLSGRVVWCGEDRQESPPLYLVGVEFEPLPPEVQAMLDASGERRNAPRRSAATSVALCMSEGVLPATADDVSDSGVRIVTSWRPDIGEVVLIRAPSETDHEGALLTGDVAWVNELDGVDEGRYEVGVRFHRVCPDVDIVFEVAD
jgi:hypothetical protein